MDDEIKEIIERYDVEEEDAEEILDIADDLGIDYDDACMIWEAM